MPMPTPTPTMPPLPTVPAHHAAAAAANYETHVPVADYGDADADADADAAADRLMDAAIAEQAIADAAAHDANADADESAAANYDRKQITATPTLPPLLTDRRMRPSPSKLKLMLPPLSTGSRLRWKHITALHQCGPSTPWMMRT